MTNSWFNPPPAETSNRFQVVLKRDWRQQHRVLEKTASNSYWKCSASLFSRIFRT